MRCVSRQPFFLASYFFSEFAVREDIKKAGCSAVAKIVQISENTKFIGNYFQPALQSIPAQYFQSVLISYNGNLVLGNHTVGGRERQDVGSLVVTSQTVSITLPCI